MKTSSYNLIPATTFGNANGETYDPLVSATGFAGTPQKAAAYYSKDKSVQTVSWFLTKFVGVVTIEATLDSDNTTDNYFPIAIVGDGVTELTENDYANLTGNYTWIRATVTQFAAGTGPSHIAKVSIGY